MPSSTPDNTPATRGFAAQLPRNLAANIAYFLVNIVIGTLLVLRFGRYQLTRSSQSYSPAFFLPPDWMRILSQNIACILSPSPNPCILPGGETL